MDMLLFGMEGGRVVWHVLVRDIMFDAFLLSCIPSLSFSSDGVAGTTKLYFCKHISYSLCYPRCTLFL